MDRFDSLQGAHDSFIPFHGNTMFGQLICASLNKSIQNAKYINEKIGSTIMWQPQKSFGAPSLKCEQK